MVSVAVTVVAHLTVTYQRPSLSRGVSICWTGPPVQELYSGEAHGKAKPSFLR